MAFLLISPDQPSTNEPDINQEKKQYKILKIPIWWLVPNKGITITPKRSGLIIVFHMRF